MPKMDVRAKRMENNQISGVCRTKLRCAGILKTNIEIKNGGALRQAQDKASPALQKGLKRGG